jgi:glyoxylase-like metal-dependent hydrolase (beta-lactamase superfamily II)
VTLTHAVTSGTFSLDGQTFDVDNNVWIVGDDREVIVIDAPHDVDAILDAVAGRRVLAIVCTHAHDDHVRFAPELADRTGAPIWLHPADEPVWQLTHPDRRWDHDLADGQEFAVGPATLQVLHTPGTPPAPCACTRRRSAASSPATPCSTGARARPGARSAAAR